MENNVLVWHYSDMFYQSMPGWNITLFDLRAYLLKAIKKDTYVLSPSKCIRYLFSNFFQREQDYRAVIASIASVGCCGRKEYHARRPDDTETGVLLHLASGDLFCLFSLSAR